MRFLGSMFDAIVNRSLEELIGALFISAAVAIAMAGLYALSRRKSSPSPTFVGGLALAAGALCMALAAGYVEYAGIEWASGSLANRHAPARWPPRSPGHGTPPPPPSFSAAGWSSGFHVVVAADENRDGRLTTEEAARMVRKADTDGDGSVSFRDIDRMIATRFFQPSLRRPSPISGTTIAEPTVNHQPTVPAERPRDTDTPRGTPVSDPKLEPDDPEGRQPK